LKAVLAIVALAAAGAVAAWSMPSDNFDPVDFFAGRSHGEGTLHELMKGGKPISVDSVGRVNREGMLVLDQTVRVAGDPVKRRQWRLRPTREGWSGTLTDAEGKVSATREGESIRIRYKMADGLKVEQLLTPRPGGGAVDNQMKIKKFGIVVARLNETIVKR
jgi:hypothetical protein